MAVIKANAYGHGDLQVAKVLLKNGVKRLAVGRADEAIKLRNHNVPCPILVLGYAPHTAYKRLVELEITLTVFNYKTAYDINCIAKKLNKTAKIHIKVDTGMNRLGFAPKQESISDIAKIASLSNLYIEGIYTHFADADNPDKSYTELQFQKFTEFLDLLTKHNIDIPIKHAANSVAIINHPGTHLNMVRPGIMLYGLYPSEAVKKERVRLYPALNLSTQVVSVKQIEMGKKISYGGTHITKELSTIATIPIGYADGFSRMQKNPQVLIHGQRALVVGRICMDLCMIDVTHISNVKVGDEVVIYGSQGKQTISIEDISKKLGTINYELICMVSARVPRKYV